MEIRFATESDIEEITHVHLNAWCGAYRGMFSGTVLEKLKPNDFAIKWHSWLKNPLRVNWIIQSTRNIYGFISFGILGKASESTNGEIYAIYIDPKFCRKGIGRNLMESCLVLLKDNNCSQVRLWVVQQNFIAQRFYEDLGFLKTNETRKQNRFGMSFYQEKFIYNF